MTPEQALKTAHIQFESATLRVHVKDVDSIDFDSLDESKPDFVMFVSKSSDYTQKKDTILIEVIGEYDLEIIADWLKKYGI